VEHTVEIVIRGKRGSGKTTVAGIINRRLEDLGFQVDLQDDEKEPAHVVEQVERSLQGGYANRASVTIRTEYSNG
jgi:adenylylsulfate kinase-like enzyme